MSELVDTWLKLLPLLSRLITSKNTQSDKPTAQKLGAAREVPDTTQSMPTVSYYNRVFIILLILHIWLFIMDLQQMLELTFYLVPSL